MTFRKVTPAALKVNVKKFWQVLLVPWHVWAPIWVHFAPWWSIFPVKNRFSHIFPVPGGLPFLTVILTVKLARLLTSEQTKINPTEVSNKLSIGLRLFVCCFCFRTFKWEDNWHQKQQQWQSRKLYIFHANNNNLFFASATNRQKLQQHALAPKN